ncbi:MAG: hypothetical protein Q8O63_01685, partial [Hoeflea sp.]|nr:hypothetical protein [Hoeflea sp.]
MYSKAWDNGPQRSNKPLLRIILASQIIAALGISSCNATQTENGLSGNLTYFFELEMAGLRVFDYEVFSSAQGNIP